MVLRYVTCTMCRSANTSLIRDNATRLYDIKCQVGEQESLNYATRPVELRDRSQTLIEGSRQLVEETEEPRETQLYKFQCDTLFFIFFAFVNFEDFEICLFNSCLLFFHLRITMISNLTLTQLPFSPSN